jgi:hypothetical protein
MGKSRRYCGFSLIEVLLAVGTLAIGMIFIGGTFLVAIHLSGVSADQTTATIVANEAFAKIKIFRVNPAACAVDSQTLFETLMSWPVPGSPPVTGSIDPNEFAYPSTRTLSQKQYFWSALCRRDPNDPAQRTLQVTVFVSRKVGAGTRYRDPLAPLNPNKWIDRPVAMPVGVSGAIGDPVLTITGDASWIGTGYTIVENSTGEVFRVVNQGPGPQIALDPDKPWRWNGAGVVWVVPPPVGRGKGPCIAVYQGEVRF